MIETRFARKIFVFVRLSIKSRRKRKVFFSIESLLKYHGSNLDSHSKEEPLKNLRSACVAFLLIHSMCLAVVSQITPQAPVGKGTVVLKAARLIDGTGAAPINNAVVVVTDNMITAVGAAGAVSIPANARTIDLGDVPLMPGFIDAHTHLIGRVLGDPAGDDAPVRDFESFAAILSV